MGRGTRLACEAPAWHLLEMTRRCDGGCSYCAASARPSGNSGGDMSVATAERVVDFIFSNSGRRVSIEMQGGEPLLNWEGVRYVVERSAARRREGREVSLSIVSNMRYMDCGKLAFLLAHGVNLCASLDGPAFLHRRNRPGYGAQGHGTVVSWLRCVQGLRRRHPHIELPNAVATITRACLPHARRIVAQYAALGLRRIQLGPLDPLGFARRNWSRLGYNAEDFVRFYSEALDAILELNARGVPLYEKGARLFLLRILRRRPLGENPETAAQFTYGCDGSIYPADSARLLANEGDDRFRMGDVGSGIRSKKAEAVRKLFQGGGRWYRTMCSRCRFVRFCVHVSPAFDCGASGADDAGGSAAATRCRIYQGVFGLLFEKLKDGSQGGLLRKWANRQS